jgi:hypothetical protein
LRTKRGGAGPLLDIPMERKRKFFLIAKKTISIRGRPLGSAAETSDSSEAVLETLDFHKDK